MDFKYIALISMGDRKLKAYYIKDKDPDSIKNIVNMYFDSTPLSDVADGEEFVFNTSIINISEIIIT